MTKPAFYSLLTAVFLSIQFSAGYATASNISRSTTSVFNFQLSLAEKDNAQAQYKLASMYELGVGTEKDIAEAHNWYTKAANNGSLEAKNRLIYLGIRKNGFQQKSHSDWLNKIQLSVNAGDQHSAMLLGQIYSYGMGVKKDLDEALRLLNKAGVYENPVVVYEVERVEKEMKDTDRHNDRQQKKRSKRPNTINKQKTPPIAKTDNSAELAAKKKAQAMTEKRRRYEEVMRKLKEEERIIEEQQAWAEGKQDLL